MRISDWSSDVCSSDLAAVEHAGALDEVAKLANIARPVVPHQQCHRRFVEAAFGVGGHLALKMEIGRASCWERVCPYVLFSVVAVSLKTTPLFFFHFFSFFYSFFFFFFFSFFFS